MNGEPVDPADSTVFLGITIESKLQWGPHIDGLANSSAAFAIKKIWSLTNVETARLVYFSYFHSPMGFYFGNAAGVQPIFAFRSELFVQSIT